MIKASLALAIIAASFSSLASIQPETKTFNEGESFEYSLSKYNYSKIAVLGEKIVKISFPEGSFFIEKDSQNLNKSDEVYIKPINEMQTNIYFSTNKGHSFSMGVKQSEGLGKTIHFISKDLNERVHVEKNDSYLTQIEKVMNDMIVGDLPKGFKAYYPEDTDFNVQNKVDLHLVTLIKGQGLNGFVYKIKNNTKKTQYLKPSMFSHKKLHALALSKNKLEPRQSAYVFSLLGALV